MAWRRENLRYRLTSARSIEETGLDSFSYGDGFAYCPAREGLQASQEIWNAAPKFNAKTMTIKDGEPGRPGGYSGFHFGHWYSQIPNYEQKQNFKRGFPTNEDIHGKDDTAESRQRKTEKRIVRRKSKGRRSGNSSKKLPDEETFHADSGNSGMRTERSYANTLPVFERDSKKIGSQVPRHGRLKAKWHQASLQDANNEIKWDFESQANQSSLSNESAEKLKSIQFTPVLLDYSIDLGKVQNPVAERQDRILPCSLTTNDIHSAAFPLITPTGKDTTEEHKLTYTLMDTDKATTEKHKLTEAPMARLLNDTSLASSTPIYEETESEGKQLTPGDPTEDCIDCRPLGSLDAFSCEGSQPSSGSDTIIDSLLPGDTKNLVAEGETGRISAGLDLNMIPVQSSVPSARSRWRQLKNTVAMANYIAANAKSSNYDLLEEEGVEGIQDHSMYAKGDAGSMGAAAFEGARTTTRSRLKGRKGMEGLLVRQEKGFLTVLQDFYVACLKLPVAHFLMGILLVPVALGMFFTPLYLLDVNGLSFDGVMDENLDASPIASTRRRCCTILNVFLYALSLSTTFGGSPVAAVSPFCLLVANTHTLIAQFLFVFLSGAVFARMSQPSHPIRCAKKAIIKNDDVIVNPGEDSEEKFKVFAIRLVLGGPTPCELVDAKLCLTFRIFIKLPNGSTFCSTQDLDLVRSEQQFGDLAPLQLSFLTCELRNCKVLMVYNTCDEDSGITSTKAIVLPIVSYLRYGLMVRHVIDKKSPIYGHNLESLNEGDASFSLTIMGLERSSMQPIFHLEDYFVCDGDVVWDGEYLDFIHINAKGQRVLDHSKIDLLKPSKVNLTDIESVSEAEADFVRKESEQGCVG